MQPGQQPAPDQLMQQLQQQLQQQQQPPSLAGMGQAGLPAQAQQGPFGPGSAARDAELWALQQQVEQLVS